MKLIFEILAKIYNILSTNFENIFYRKFKPKNELELKGFTVLRNELKSIIDYSRTDYLVVNKYLRKLIFSNDDIEKILKKLFISEKLFDKITKLTGFNYSVDFLIAYETLPISDEDKSKGWYANHIHNDKPFSKNTLKLIIPLETIESDNGPMEIISKENKINFSLNDDNNNFFKFSGYPNDIFIFKPNLCFHRAGIPKKNKIRKQIMLQLNPSKYWKYNKSLFKFQKIREPKFPLLAYFFDRKEKLV